VLLYVDGTYGWFSGAGVGVVVGVVVCVVGVAAGLLWGVLLCVMSVVVLLLTLRVFGCGDVADGVGAVVVVLC